MANKIGFIVELQNKFSRVASKVSKSMRTLGKNTDKVAKANKRLAKSFGGLKKDVKNAIGGIIAVFSVREFIRRGAAFEDAIADLSAITGAAGKDLQALSAETLRLAKSSAIAQVEVAQAFTQIASAKSELLKDPKGLTVVTEQVLLLANAAGIAVPDAVRASVGALNQFNAGADQAARFVNVIAAGAKVGASLVGETAEALKNAGTVAAKFNLSFEETNALIQVLAKNEVKAAEAGTSLRGTLVKLENFMGGQFAPSKVGIIRSLEILSKLGLSNTQIIKDFGQENLRSILIFRENIPLIKQWTKELTGTNVAQQQAEIRLSTFNAKLRRLGVSITDKVIKTFNRLSPVLTEQVAALGKWFDTIDEKKVEAFAEVIAQLAKSISILAKGLALITKAFNVVGRGIGVGVAKAEQFLIRGGESKFAIQQQEARLAEKGLARSSSNRVTSEQIQTAGTRNRLEGQITINATNGTEIKSSSLKTTGRDINIGLNVLPEGT